MLSVIAAVSITSMGINIIDRKRYDSIPRNSDDNEIRLVQTMACGKGVEMAVTSNRLCDGDRASIRSNWYVPFCPSRYEIRLPPDYYQRPDALTKLQDELRVVKISDRVGFVANCLIIAACHRVLTLLPILLVGVNMAVQPATRSCYKWCQSSRGKQ